MEIGNKLEIMFNNKEELDFLLKHLSPECNVLEYGSGGSTLEIAKHVKTLYSVEHDKNWYDKVKQLIPPNVILHYVPRNKVEAVGHDGTEEDYKDYIHAPIDLYPQIKFDVIFIDGRARPHCAKKAVGLLKENGIILIHDYRHPQEQYRRYEYETVEEFLQVIDGTFALWSLKPKKS